MRGLFKFLIFIGILAGLYYGRAYFIRSGVEEQSLGFVKDTVSTITLNWNRYLLDKSADPVLASQVMSASLQHPLDFNHFARMGLRTSDVGCTLGDYTTFKDETRNYIGANYTCAAQFERGDATIYITVMRNKDNAPWTIGYFDVTSPILNSPAPQRK